MTPTAAFMLVSLGAMAVSFATARKRAPRRGDLKLPAGDMGMLGGSLTRCRDLFRPDGIAEGPQHFDRDNQDDNLGEVGERAGSGVVMDDDG